MLIVNSERKGNVLSAFLTVETAVSHLVVCMCVRVSGFLFFQKFYLPRL